MKKYIRTGLLLVILLIVFPVFVFAQLGGGSSAAAGSNIIVPGVTATTVTSGTATVTGAATISGITHAATVVTPYTINWPPQPGKTGQVLQWGGSSTNSSWISQDEFLPISGQFGGFTSVPGPTALQIVTTPTIAGHFVDLSCTIDSNGSICTLPPSFAVRDDTTGIVGLPLLCPSLSSNTIQSQSLTFNSGDKIGIVRISNGMGCISPLFSVVGHFTNP